MDNYIFGPVPSRRLGISLGVDIVPFKTCSLDCIYCECGHTTSLTVKRERFADPRVILQQVQEVVRREEHIDYITFSGSGEPTLNRDIGMIIDGFKAMTKIPVAVLTNGSLLFREEVRKDLLKADLVLPSLDAATEQTFQKINRPHQSLELAVVIGGMIEFAGIFQGQVWLEIFFAKGINDSDRDVDALADTIRRINPDKIQLNSLDRPAAHRDVAAVDMEFLEGIVKRWKALPVEIIKKTKRREEIASFSRNLENSILNTIRRRPLTIEDLCNVSGKKRAELYKYIDVLEREKKILQKIVADKIFFVPFDK